MTLELVPLAEVTLKLDMPQFLSNAPKGSRVIVGLQSGRWEGERLNASLSGNNSGDWAYISSDGTLSVDVRQTLKTDDGALIFVSYQGRSDFTQKGAAPIYVAPVFETGDERYSWLNKIQAVGRGMRTEEGLTYTIYEVR